MPGKIKVKILAGRNLPVMDRSSDTTDAYVEIKFGNTTYKTDVCRKSLNPQWNSEWYRFEVDDSELQDEPLQIKLMDHDTYSANDAIGKVYVNLNPLLLPGVPPPVKNIWTLEATMNSCIGAQGGSVMTGWVPVFDTMHGIRGEVNIIVKVELFLDFNKFRQSSCGVQFFYSPNVPYGYHAQVIHGFVEELIVSDDPEYKWIDKIRTPRASNESRQTLFFKLSGEVQRKIGLKALDLGGNAVIGYLQNFDLEGESGIVARGIGTAVTLVKVHDLPNVLPEDPTVEELATFDSKSKKNIENLVSEDNVPLLSHSPVLTPNVSPTNMCMTHVGQKFPYYGRTTPKHSKTLMNVVDCRYQLNRDPARPFSPLSYNFNSKKILESSVSLSDDVIDESSIRNLLALEDLRGEPLRNRFSRSLKNLKYLQQNVLSKRVTQLRSKVSESLDEESDGDSTYSSTWSIGGTDSTRSSALDLRKNVRNKSFSRSKSANEGMVALLIKSVHTGFPAPLDIVKEDRETPAPSPVKFLADGSDSTKTFVDTENIEKESDDKDNRIFASSSNANVNPIDNKYNHDFSIPMISSSETDTSSDDDEPSESSTNYNILDDTSSLNELVLPELGKSCRRVSNKMKSKKESSLRGESKICEDKNQLPISRKSSLQTDGSTSTEPTSSDVDSDFFHDKLEGKSRKSQDEQEEIIILSKENDRDRNEATNIEFELEIPFEELEEDKDSLRNENIEKVSNEFCKIFENTEPVKDIENKFEKESLQDNLNLHENLNESLLFFGQMRKDDLNFEETQNEVNIPSLQKPITLFEDKYTESTPIIQPEEIEEPGTTLFYEDDKNIESNLISDEEDNEILNEPFFKDNRSTESIIFNKPEKFETPFLNDNEGIESSIKLEDSEVFDEPFLNDNKNIETNLISPEKINDIFDEPFFKDNKSTESTVIIHPRKVSVTFFESDKIIEPNSISRDKDYKIFNEPFFQDKKSTESSIMIQSEQFDATFYKDLKSNVKEEKDNELFNEPFFKDNENSALTLFRQEKIENEEDNLKDSHEASVFLDNTKESNVLLNFNDIKTNHNTFDNLSFGQKNTSNLIFDVNEQMTFNLLDNTNQDIIDNVNKDKYPLCSERNLNSNLLSNESLLSFSTSGDLSNHDNYSPSINQKEIFILSNPLIEISGKGESGLVQTSIFNNSIHVTEDNLLHKESENQITERRKSLKRQISQYEESNPEEFSENTSQEKIEVPINKITPSLENTREIVQFKDTEPFSHKPSQSHSENLNSPEDKITPKKDSEREDKISRGVERSDTVIYKGPLDENGRPLTPKIEKRLPTPKEPSLNLSPISIFVEQFSEKTNFLKVPIVHTLDVNVKSTYTKKETELAENLIHKTHQEEELKYAEILRHKFRRSCMLDLMKIIDTKMMVHSSHHSSHKKDSFRCTKKRRDKIFKNLTPSPDSVQKVRIHKLRSKSRSPELYPFGKFPSTSTLNSTHSSHHHSAKKHVSITHNLPLENTLKHFPDNSHIPNAILMKENPAKKIESSINNEIRKAAVDKLVIDPQNNDLNNSNINFELHELKPDNFNSSVLTTEIVESSLQKSSSICSLDKPVKELVELTKNTNASVTDNLCVSYSPPPLRQQDENSTSPVHANATNFNNSLTGKTTNSTNSKTNTAIPLHRRSSDSDLSITPKGNSLASSERSMGGYLKPTTAIRTMNQDASDMLEYPFLTIHQYPPGFILHIGGLVSARSVKLLERISNLEEPESRDAWWTEIRMEVRSHARALACNVVIGYKEETSISDDVCVLNASGTAAVINLHNTNQDLDSCFLNRPQQGMTTSIDLDREKSQQKVNNKNDKNENEMPLPNQSLSGKVKRTSESNDHEIPYSLPLSNCSLCHLPYSESSVPFKVNVTKCAVCRRAKVPDVLFTTIELPENVPVTGRGCFVQAIVCKCKKDLRGELNAKEISDCLPFLEYELHSLLLNKLKVKGMNSIFGLKVQVSVGERLIIGMAIGTGIYLTSLPSPSLPQLASGNSWNNEEQLNEIRKNLVETVKKNREFYKLKNTDVDNNGRSRSDTDESDDDLPDIDLSLGTKDACVLEVDDVEDMDRICLLMDDTPPDDFHVVNTQSIPGLDDLEIIRNLQMFTQVSRAKIPSGQFGSMPSKYFARLLQTVYFKLRRMVPCALCDMKFRVALPEQDEIQLSVVGMALGLGEPSKHSKHKRKLMTYSSSKDQIKKADDCDMIFTLDEDVAETGTITTTNAATNTQSTLVLSQKPRPRSPLRIKSHTMQRHKHVPIKERYGVDITPLSYLPGGKIERYLGNLNFFFIRESTSIRENGGISGFTHSFVNEVLAIVRAHVTTLGGNAMVAFFMTQCVLLHSPHKNHGQCLINVGGDVVSVSYFGDERQIGNTIC